MKVLLKQHTQYGAKGEIRDIDKDILATFAPSAYEVQEKEAKAVENKAILSPKTTKKVK